MKEIKMECQSCGGFGVVENPRHADNEVGIVCHQCNGKGFTYFKYREFNQRRARSDIKKVYDKEYSYKLLKDETITLDNGLIIDYSKEGVEYEDWLNGNCPKPIRQLTCPFLEDGHQDKYEFGCCDNVRLSQRISECKHFKTDRCWKIYDESNR